MDSCSDDERWGAVAQGGVAGSGKFHGLLAQGRRGGQPTTCDQTRQQKQHHHGENRIRLDRGGDTQGNKRRRMVQTEDIEREDTTAAEESRREMAERVARYVPD